MTSIERTAYPRFKRLLSARELHVFYTPQPDEVAWARYADWAEHLLSPAECTALLPAFCAEVGIPADGAGFRAELDATLRAAGSACDGGYPDNADLVIADNGVPSLKRYQAAAPTPTATALEKALAERMPERTLLGILARTGHWLEWWRRFGPASGSDPKLPDAFFRYTLTTFTYGSNLGPAQAARHMAGVSARELGATFRRHMSIGKLNKAIADAVDAFTELDLVRAWGDGRRGRYPGRDVHRPFREILLAGLTRCLITTLGWLARLKSSAAWDGLTCADRRGHRR